MMYTVLGALIVLAAAGGCWFALCFDRPRGRRRCPGCWYDFKGLPVAPCPECGRAIKLEGELWRVRRRWRLAFVSALIATAGAGTAVTPKIQRDGWWSVSPRIVVIAALPILKPDPSSDRRHLWHAAHRDLLRSPVEPVRLWRPERWLLLRSCRAILLGDASERCKAIAARLLVLYSPSALTDIPLEHAAPVIVAKTIVVYRTVDTYQDRGTARRPAPAYDTEFMTNFSRAGGLRFESASRLLFSRTLVVANEGGAHCWRMVPHGYRKFDSAFAALLDSAADSSGVSRYVAVLLLHDATEVVRPWFFDGAGVPALEEISGRLCYRLPCRWGTAWIDTQTHLLLRFQEPGPGQTIIFNPEIGSPQPPHLFEAHENQLPDLLLDPSG